MNTLKLYYSYGNLKITLFSLSTSCSDLASMKLEMGQPLLNSSHHSKRISIATRSLSHMLKRPRWQKYHHWDTDNCNFKIKSKREHEDGHREHATSLVLPSKQTFTTAFVKGSTRFLGIFNFDMTKPKGVGSTWGSINNVRAAGDFVDSLATERDRYVI